ncbi:hypothetical protein [Streptomyces subrutilus]|uniref:hypothetical protein n=1 Tax=Streptomyces subrutilus TaxID=36818 RepID=UPI0033F139F7
MSAVVRWSGRSLAAVLLSAAVAWGAPVAAPPAQARAPASVVLSPDTGPPGTAVEVAGSCETGPGANTAVGETSVVDLFWDGSLVESAGLTDEGAFGFSFSVPDDAGSGPHPVTADCRYGAVRSSATATFTVALPALEPVVALVPDEGEAGTVQPVLSGSGFDCPEVELLWDGAVVGTSAVSEAAFQVTVEIAAGTAAGGHTLLVRCAGDPGRAAEAAFTVTAPEPSPEPSPTDTGLVPSPAPLTPDPLTPDPATPLPPTPNVNSGGGGAAPVGWVVGSGLLGAGLLAAAGAAFLAHRQRGPRWVRGHVSTRLRPSPNTTRVTGPPGHSVRLEPRTDPGEQTVQEEDR